MYQMDAFEGMIGGNKMKVNAKSIDLAKVQAEAEESYRKGFFCCEAVMEVIMDNFELMFHMRLSRWHLAWQSVLVSQDVSVELSTVVCSR